MGRYQAINIYLNEKKSSIKSIDFTDVSQILGIIFKKSDIFT